MGHMLLSSSFTLCVCGWDYEAFVLFCCLWFYSLVVSCIAEDVESDTSIRIYLLMFYYANASNIVSL